MLVEFPGKLNVANYLEVLNHDEEMQFQGIFYQQPNSLVNKSKIIGNFVQEKDIKELDGAAYSPDLNPIEKIWEILMQRLQKQTVILGKIKKLKCHKIGIKLTQMPLELCVKINTNRLWDA